MRRVWAAAGHPHGVFQLSPQELQQLTGAPVADLAVDVDQEKLALKRAIGLVSLFRPVGMAEMVMAGMAHMDHEEAAFNIAFGIALTGTRVLSPGGALFVFNLPKWLVHYAAVLESHGMTFRHWIACRMPNSTKETVPNTGELNSRSADLFEMERP